MAKWQQNRKTTPPQVTQQEKTSPNNNESTDAEIEEIRRLLTGATLTQASCTEQFATLLTLAVQSNSATPKTVVALSFALSEMVNLSTSMCDQLRALTTTLMRSRQTTPSDAYVLSTVNLILQLMRQIVDVFDF
jgi:hypothetical protein